MFEIGNSLHEARSRRGIDFPEAELATKIRGKYLRALEDERFELLPAQTYIKGFLRTYAEYLGLDGQLYVDEYNSRFGAGGEESESRARRSAARPQHRNRRIETNVVLISLAAIAVVTVVVIAAWKSTGSSSPSAPPTTPAVTKPKATHRAVKPPLLLIQPLRGTAHVTVRSGGANGAVKFDGTLQKGNQPVTLQGTRLWLTVDSPENVRLKVRGRVVPVRSLAPEVIIVTPLGWQFASS